ncbi:MAG: hypothetical protein RXQ93_06140 [Caldisphaera sp.]
MIIEKIPPYFDGEGFVYDRPFNLFLVSSVSTRDPVREAES